MEVVTGNGNSLSSVTLLESSPTPGMYLRCQIDEKL